MSETLNGGTTENCALLVPLWDGWNDWSCIINKAQPINCACEHHNQMYLQLRGLCPDSNIDLYYVPRNKKNSGSVILIGLKNTVIEYDRESLVWMISVHGIPQNTSATSDSSYDSYVLGSHTWTMADDNLGCSNKGEPYQRVLKMTGCEAGEFTCSDGQCIRSWCSHVS